MSEAHSTGFSFGCVLLLVVPLALVAGAAKVYSGSSEQQAQVHLENTMFSRLLGQSESSTLSKDYKDADGDLVADAPPDAESLDPEVIKFSYVASSDSDDEAETWKELLAALEAKLGRKVELVEYT